MWPSDNHLPGARPKTGPPRPDRPPGCDKGIDSPPKIPPAFRFRPRRRVCADCLLCKSVANLSRGPDRGGRGRASPAVTPTARGPRGPVGGRDPDIFVRHAVGMTGGTCACTCAYVCAWARAPTKDGRRTPDPRVLLARCLKTRGVTSKNVGRQRSMGRFRYISVGHSAHERKVGPCVAVLRGPSVDR